MEAKSKFKVGDDVYYQDWRVIKKGKISEVISEFHYRIVGERSHVREGDICKSRKEIIKQFDETGDLL